MPFPTLNPALARALDARGYSEPTSVQAEVLAAPVDRDLLVSAQTGSGKTVGYGLAFAPTLMSEEDRLPPAGPPLALIIAPTRELALQVHGELRWLYAEAGARVVACIGGMDARREARLLSQGAHIVVGTPGRLKDHLERKQLDPSALRVVVLDEADEMLDMGFREELEFILDATPGQRRTLLFSATIPRDIAMLAKRYQRNALRIDTVDRNQPHQDIEYRAMRIDPDQIEGAIVNTLRLISPRSAIIFCARRESVRGLADALIARGFTAVALSGELSQHERNTALQAVRDGRAQVCVATDVAARGLDLPDLGLVIHADLPTNKDTLLHRSGRTGRAGRKGIAVLLVPHPRRRKAELLLSWAGLTASWGTAPTAEQIRAQDRAHLLADPMLSAPPSDGDVELAYQLAERHGAEALAAAFIRLRRQLLPSPVEIAGARATPDESQPRTRSEGAERAERPYVPRESFRAEDVPMVWYRTSVGRKNKADPKWLLPLICRLGQVTKKDVGAIRISEHETRFQITETASEAFAAALGNAGENEIRIEAADGPPPAQTHARREDRPHRSTKPRSYGDSAKPSLRRRAN
jgi:ATP-dependent RNA helicase DeaD